MLNKEQILKAQDLKTQEVDVPEWGDTVTVRALTSCAFQEVQEALKGKNAKAFMVMRCLVDEDGKQLFAETDVEALGEKSQDVIDRLADVVLELSGLGEHAGKDLEENLEATL